MPSRMTAKGSPVVMVAVCSATSPPPISSTAATTPSSNAQKRRERTGGLGSPPEVMMSMTMEPESEEVTKKVMTTTMPRKQVTELSGKFSSMTKRDTGRFSCTAVAMPPAPNISMFSAVLTKMVIHRNVMNVGTSMTPMMNSRMVRPKDTRAMNMPTKGDQAIHQAQ